MIGPPHQLAAVPRKDGAAVVASLGGNLLLAGAVALHGPQIQISGSQRRVDDPAGLPVYGRFSIVTRRVGQLLANLAVGPREVNVIARKHAPDVAFAAIRPGGTGGARLMC